jgi:4-amino-4-deoxy-L-arabinose transferase-like glycosyltransferase
VTDRLQRFVVAGFLAFFLTVSLMSMSGKSATVDEPKYVAAGYAYLRTGDVRLNREHPPLMKAIAAALLLPLELDPVAAEGTSRERARGFLFANRLSADRILFWGRLPVVLMGTALGWFVFWWSRRLAGPFAGLVALALYVCDPTITAHAQLITLDLGLAFFSTLAVYALLRYLGAPHPFNLWRLAFAFAAAVLTKFSALMLAPIYLTLTAFARMRRGPRGLIGCWARIFPAMAAATLLAAFVAYGFDVRPAGRPPQSLVALIERATAPGSALRRVSLRLASAVPVPMPDFWKGMLFQTLRRSGPTGYLLGDEYPGARLAYFPVAFVVKTPAGMLGIVALAAGIFLYRGVGRGTRSHINPEEWGIALAAAGMFGLSLFYRFNVGIRYILPVYPLLFVAAATQIGWVTGLATRLRTPLLAATGVLVALVALSSVRSYPHYLAYFNELVGGSKNGWRYLTNSNLDWGQDLGGLATYLKRHGIAEVYLEYFGPSPPEYYGIRWKPVPSGGEVASRGLPPGVVAMSVTTLMRERTRFGWLLAYQPTTTIGYSIWIFDLRPEER